MRDKILEEDLTAICRERRDYLDALDGKTVLITGVTGLIGSQLAKTLLFYDHLHGTRIGVAGIARTQERVQQVFQDMPGRELLRISYRDICEIQALDLTADFIIHCANSTSSKEFVDRPVETIQCIVSGTSAVLEVARRQRACSVVYLSSMEMYGSPDPSLAQVTEDDGGYIDPLNVRSSYSEGKRLAECLCASYAREYRVDVKIARLAQVFGADVDFRDNRIFAQLARCALHREDFVMRTEGRSYGNYCYTRDAVRAILMLLTAGSTGEAYNVVNETACMTIREMAELAAREIGEDRFQILYDIPPSALTYGYAPDVVLRLSAKKLRQLGWRAEVPLGEMYRRMISSMEYRLNDTPA